MTLEKPSAMEAAVEVAPEPGPRRSRPRWTGEFSDAPTATTPFARYLPTSADARRRLIRHRIVGIDAGKGFALLAMVAIHALPKLDPATGEATWIWSLFGGTAAALFCVLAGTGLALNTGANHRYRGRQFERSLVNIVFRALLLFGIGLAVNSVVDLGEADILVYFAAMYLLALPLYALRGRQLLVLVMLFVIVTPIIRYAFDQQIQGEGYHVNPSFGDLFQDPLGVLSTIFLTGTFPALTWITFICLGLAIGRLTLLRPGTPLLFATAGLIIAGGANLISWLLVRTPEGYNAVRSSMDGASEQQVDRFLEVGPQGGLPTSTPGWLLSSAPLAQTTWSIAIGAGFSLTAIGLFIVLARKLPQLLRPIIDVGSMPVTIYVGHLLLFTLANGIVSGWALFTMEAVLLIAFAVLWRKQFNQGPLEYCITHIAEFAARLVLPVKPAEQR